MKATPSHRPTMLIALRQRPTESPPLTLLLIDVDGKCVKGLGDEDISSAAEEDIPSPAEVDKLSPNCVLSTIEAETGGMDVEVDV